MFANILKNLEQINKMKKENIVITFDNGATIEGELVSWSKEYNSKNELVQYNFSIKQ